MHAHLQYLRPACAERKLTAQGLADLTGISHQRIKGLANKTTQDEPWLSEAYIIHRALGTHGILPLMSKLPLAQSPMDIPFDSDLRIFRNSKDVSLSLACRIAVRFGLDDPAQLVVDPLHRTMWEIMERSERSSDQGFCPWCRAHISDPHLDTCLPHNLWGPRVHGVLTPALAPVPRRSGVRKTSSGRAFGMKRVRTALGMTQQQLGAPANINNNTIAKIERGDDPLTRKMAERLTHAHHGIPITEWWLHDTDPSLTVWPASWGARP